MILGHSLWDMMVRLFYEKKLNISWASWLWKLWVLFMNPFSSSTRFNSHDTAVNVSRIFLIFVEQSRCRSPLFVETSFHSTFSYEVRFTFRMSNALIKIFVTPFSNSVASLNKFCNSDFAARSIFKQKFKGKFLAEGFLIVDKIFNRVLITETTFWVRYAGVWFLVQKQTCSNKDLFSPDFGLEFRIQT